MCISKGSVLCNYFTFCLPYSLEIWPGFVTSIAQYESSVMLCADISHKILRTDTVLDLFYSLKSDPDFHNSATRSIVGEIVLTRSDTTCIHVLLVYQLVPACMPLPAFFLYSMCSVL